MANNIPAFQTELQSLLASTTNIDAATKVKIRDRIVSEYQSDYAAWLASFDPDRTDTNPNRAEFGAKKWCDWVKDIYRAGSVRENTATTPPPESL